MSWTIDTFAGTQATGDPSGWRTALFELCRGVNEREDAVLETKTQFRDATGSLKSDIGMLDLLGLTFSQCEENLLIIQDSIIVMIETGKFAEESNSATAWTVASLEADLSIDLQLGPIRPQEARFWQAQKDALDAMTHTIASCELSNIDSHTTGFLPGKSTPQLSWDNKAYPGPFIEDLSAASSFKMTKGDSFNYVMSILGPATFDCVLPAYLGVVVGTAYSLLEGNSAAETMTYECGSLTYPLPIKLWDPRDPTWRIASSVDLTLGATTNIGIEFTPLPSIQPYGVFPVGPQGREMVVLCTGAAALVDLETILTDQA